MHRMYNNAQFAAKCVKFSRTAIPAHHAAPASINSNKNTHSRHEYHATNIGFDHAAKAPPL